MRSGLSKVNFANRWIFSIPRDSFPVAQDPVVKESR